MLRLIIVVGCQEDSARRAASVVGGGRRCRFVGGVGVTRDVPGEDALGREDDGRSSFLLFAKRSCNTMHQGTYGTRTRN
jgi:hypothetical protein